MDSAPNMGMRAKNWILRARRDCKPFRKQSSHLSYGNQSLFAHLHQHFHLEFGHCGPLDDPPVTVDYSHNRSLSNVHPRSGSHINNFSHFISIHIYRVVFFFSLRRPSAISKASYAVTHFDSPFR